jgi:hypothetical protein
VTQTLAYHEPGETRFRLDESNGVVTLTFPVMPRWVAISIRVVVVLCALAYTMQTAIMFVEWRRICAMIGMPMLPWGIRADIMVASLEAALLWLVAVYVFVDCAQRRRISGMLQIQDGKIIFERHRFLRLRRRTYSISEVRHVKLKLLKDVFRRKPPSEIQIEFISRRSITFRIRGSDTFPRRVVEAFNRALTRERTCASGG